MITMLAGLLCLTCGIQSIQESQLRSLDMGGFMHPHSFLRLPNGHCPRHLPAFAQRSKRSEQMGVSGGLVEIDDQGKLIRASSSADAAFPACSADPLQPSRAS